MDIKRKKKLRGIANRMDALYQIGKNEVTANTLDMLDKALTAREMVKISILKTVDTPIRELALDLCADLKAELVQIIGRCVILYRESDQHLYL